MATEIVRVGPFDEYPDCSHMTGEGYRENRGLDRIELELKRDGFPFSFLEHLQETASRFPEAKTLEVFEGGCGYGCALRGIKNLESAIQRPIRTTGSTLALRHIPKEGDPGIDNFVLGSVQNFLRQTQEQAKYHFILDFYGAVGYDIYMEKDRIYEGSEVIPCYNRLLAPSGTVLTTVCILSSKLVPYLGSGPRQRTLDLFERNGLKVLQEKRGHVLLEKK